MKNSDHFDERKLPDFLEDLRKENPFTTPHNYFDALPDQIMQRIHEENSRSLKNSWWEELLSRWNLMLNPSPAWALAMVLIMGTVFWISNPNNHGTELLQDHFSANEIAEYVQNHIDEFEVSDFYAQDVDDIDILSETLRSDEIDPIFNDLMDDIDLETLQRIL
ncbi:MAG: hypothetical protein KDC53_00060 [Saprospiraceae bacterium]|nr:hypothetical protein [Saprospiraceae bacterium]